MEDDGGEWVLVPRTKEKDMWDTTLSDLHSKPLRITFDRPAKYWTDSCPIGNGRLGAMVWGGVSPELIQLNEDTLWTGVPTDFTNSDAPEALSQVRNLVDNGEFAEASEAAAKLFGHPGDVYQLLGDISLEFDDSHLSYGEETYRRELDLDTATVHVQYSVGDVEFTREHFASNPDQVIVTKISGSKPGSLCFTVSFDCKLDHRSYVNGASQIIMEGSCPGERIPPENAKRNDDPKGIQFAAVLDLQVSDGVGKIHVVDENKLKVEGSNWVVLLLVASSSFEGPYSKPSDSKRDPISESVHALESIKDLSYADLYARHLDDYQNLFHRVSLQLWKSSKISDEPLEVNGLHSDRSTADVIPTANRIKSFQSDEDPSLVELLFQFGRYLLISCSRPGTRVANLQGIWNKDLQPSWDSAPHLNINLEMNYWPSMLCNLSECQEPLFDFLKCLSDSGSKVAHVNYKTSGWVVHHKSDIWAKSSADRGDASWAIWPMGGAWLCTHLWEYYKYTMDKDFLKNKAYPLLEGCASFLLDWLIEEENGYLETNPSTSPEHFFIAPDGKPASISYSSTMDMAIIREIFTAIIAASEILERNEEALVQRVHNALPHLHPTKIAEDGSIMEWAKDFEDQEVHHRHLSHLFGLFPGHKMLYHIFILRKLLKMVLSWNGCAKDFEDQEVHHRHLSHLFGLFPGHTITMEKNPDICKAAEITLHKRGWSTAWKIALWARLHNSEHAYRMVKHLIKLVDSDKQQNDFDFEGGLYSNLFAAHPPFQIDANFGFTAAVGEMLVQSTMEDLYLLPALPRDKWGRGCVRGLKARGGVTINISWKEGDLHEVGLYCKDGRSSLHRLHYRGITVTTCLSSGEIHTFNMHLQCVKSERHVVYRNACGPTIRTKV